MCVCVCVCMRERIFTFSIRDRKVILEINSRIMMTITPSTQGLPSVTWRPSTVARKTMSTMATVAREKR